MDDLPILEFDPEPRALIDPYDRPPVPGVPVVAVACHFLDVLEKVTGGARRVFDLPSREPFWSIDVDGVSVGVFYPGHGAPLATVSLERVAAAGCQVVVGCGAAGALVPLEVGELVVVDAAVRDEGTSYHYLPPAREVSAHSGGVAALVAAAANRGARIRVGKTWTTDACFRETPARIAARRAEGCIVVDMEVAAMFAVAEFRSFVFAQVLYAGDDVSGAQWKDRGWTTAHDARLLTFDLAVAAARRLGSVAAS